MARRHRHKRAKRIVSFKSRKGVVKFQAAKPNVYKGKGIEQRQLVQSRVDGKAYKNDTSQYAPLRKPQGFAWGAR